MFVSLPKGPPSSQPTHWREHNRSVLKVTPTQLFKDQNTYMVIQYVLKNQNTKLKKPTNDTVLFTLLCPGFHLPCSGRPCHPPPYLLPGCLPPGVSGSCRACEQQQGGMASRVPSTEDTRSRISNHWTDKTDFISHFTHWSISLSPPSPSPPIPPFS